LKIPATIHSDDGGREANFDATPWFERASVEQINGLRRIGFAKNYEADSVAEFIAEQDLLVQEVLEYCRETGVGFEVYIDADAAEIWIAADYAKKLLRRVTGED
jgi:hypothetical protein